MTSDRVPHDFQAFIPPDPNAKCQICYDYGGLIDVSSNCMPDGEPITESCTCKLPDGLDD